MTNRGKLEIAPFTYEVPPPVLLVVRQSGARERCRRSPAIRFEVVTEEFYEKRDGLN